MNSKLTLLYAFLGGAIVGTGAALLFAPEKGADVRNRIADILKKKGICCKKQSEIEEIVGEIEAIVAEK